MAAAVQKLHLGELRQQENLIALLGAVKGSKLTGSESQIPTLVRGLCTCNQKLLAVVSQNMATCVDMDAIKNIVNEFLLWFDTSFIVFERLLLCLSVLHLTDSKLYQPPVLHCKSYVEFSLAMSGFLRNPFIVDKLLEVQSRASALIDRAANMLRKALLDDISFDHVQTFGGKSVSCFFTPSQIVRRSEDSPLLLGKSSIEMVLLNLGLESLRMFDSWVILRVPTPGARRSVIYPPFRVNELSMVFSEDAICFSSLLLDSGKHEFTISGNRKILELWFHDLRTIFPTSEKLLRSSTVQMQGLGIETALVSSDEQLYLPFSIPDAENLPKETRHSLDSNHSLEIMKKTLSNSGIEADVKERQLTVVKAPQQHYSIEAEYAYPDDAMAEISLEGDSMDGFEVVPPKPKHSALGMGKYASASVPNVSTSSSIYINAAGSAVDVSNFGKSHNPSFASLPAAEKKVPKKKSLLNLFRKKKNDEASPASNEKSKSSTHSHNEIEKTFSEDIPLTKPAAQKNTTGSTLTKTISKERPANLLILIPKISALDANISQPVSATSTSNRTLPLPFALPSSTSTYFFKPHLNSSNGSTTSLPGANEEKPYAIPQEFKDIVNAEDTLDFYITPVSPNSIKVSKWKARFGKWEMLTSNENVFLKIVANYNIYKSWLLVFKEEYDEGFGEVIDKPLLVLDLNENTSARLSTALDIEIHATDAFSSLKTHIIVRCFSGSLIQDISTNLSNILEVMDSKKSLKQSTKYESMGTISSSLVSKPSASSTLTSIFTHLESQTPAGSICNSADQSGEALPTVGGKLLLDRITIKLHKQMELYEQIHRASSWKAFAMYSLSILHSTDASQVGLYHFDMQIKENAIENQVEEMLWTFSDDKIHEHIEIIGKAATLVKLPGGEIFMLECRGKKELKRLLSLF